MKLAPVQVRPARARLMRDDRIVDNPLTALPIEALRARHSVKWRQYEPDVLPLFVAEMDTPLAPPIAEVLTAAMARGDTGYAHPGQLREAFAGFAQRHYGWSPDPGQMVVVPDALRGISEVLKLVSSPGCRRGRQYSGVRAVLHHDSGRRTPSRRVAAAP